jgi:hypothetical protein
MEHNQNSFTPGASTDARAPSPTSSDPAAADGGFDPVPVRARHDGWTPQKQAAFVEALADTGLTRTAAAAVGMTEQSVNRLRRRADARSFDLACDAAARIGARRLRETAWERAIEGTVRYRYYKGEVVGEERVYDNKLLIYLLGKTAQLAEPSPESALVAANWEPWLTAIEAGAPPPEISPQARRRREAMKEDAFMNHIWNTDGHFYTDFPPPRGFGGRQWGVWGHDKYKRTLSPEEHDALLRNWPEHPKWAPALACRDAFFGFEGGELLIRQTEPSEPSEPSEPVPLPDLVREAEDPAAISLSPERDGPPAATEGAAEGVSSHVKAEPSEPSGPPEPHEPPEASEPSAPAASCAGEAQDPPPPAAEPVDWEAWERNYEIEWARQHAAWKAANGIEDDPAP